MVTSLGIKKRQNQEMVPEEHFNEVLNRERSSNPVSIGEIEAPGEIEEIDTSEPTKAEIKQAKFPKAGIDFAIIKAKEIINIVWREERTPGKWRKELIVRLPAKRDLTECKNSRGFTLLAVVSKVKGKIVIKRIRSGVKPFSMGVLLARYRDPLKPDSLDGLTRFAKAVKRTQW